MIDLAQLRAWYSDPVRKLPRKVVADVLALVAEVEKLKWHVENADANEAKAKKLASQEAELRFKAEAELRKIRV